MKPLISWLVDSHLLTMSSYGLSSVLRWNKVLCLFFPYKDTSPMGSEPHPYYLI